jgi:hypothetical protein
MMIFLEKQMGRSIVFLVIDDQLWNMKSATVFGKFASPRCHRRNRFTINQYPVKIMEGFMTDDPKTLWLKRR